MKIKNVYIEITNQCNLNCRTCYNRSGLNKQKEEISVEFLEKLILTLSEYGADRFLLSGGEPSLHSRFHDILKLTDRYPQFSYGFVTNGTVLDNEWIDYINSHDNLTLQISLDGANEKQNALTRGIGNFEKAVTFAQRINNNNIQKRIKAVISQGNIDCVEDFYRLAVSLGFDPEFAFIYKSGNGSDNWGAKALSAQQKLHILKTVDNLNKEYGIDAFLPLCSGGCPLAFESSALNIAVKPNGSIHPCQSLYDDRFSIGNAFDFSIDETKQKLEIIRSIAKHRTISDYGCNKCLLNSICGRGCMAEAFHLNEDPLANDGSCLYRKSQFLHFNIKEIRKPPVS